MSAFVYLFRASAAEQREAMRPERAQQSLQAMMAWLKDLEQKGHLKNPGLPLEPSGRVVSGKGGVISDGPYAEAKDMVLGFIVVEARDMAQAIELARSCPMVTGGAAVEIRPIGQSTESRVMKE
jgi:hypothetical protein